MSDLVVEVEGLRKSYGSLTAVDDVCLEVAEGEIFGLVGRNGAGKTTTVECVQGLLTGCGDILHGSSSNSLVHSYPASHSCVRVWRPDIHQIFAETPIGTPVVVYGTWR